MNQGAHDFVSKTAADDSSRAISCDFFSSRKFPNTKTSILVRSKQAKASSGRQTIGSLSLNDVFSKTGTPVKSPKARMSRQYSGWVSRLTVCRRAVPSTCVGAGITARFDGRTGYAKVMNGDG